MTKVMEEFGLPSNSAVYVCTHVGKNRAPVLYVSHDEDGDWQFLCGAQHGDGSDDEPMLVALREAIADDSSIGEVADMCEGWEAERASVGEPWVKHDRHEDKVRADVEEFGWHVVLISEGEAGEPCFGYTIGLWRNCKHPEIIAFGLTTEHLHAMLNNCCHDIKRGGRFAAGARSDTILENYRCAFKTFKRAAYPDHLGYARWFYGGSDFPVVQLVWPDPNDVLPWEERCKASTVQSQPALWEDE